MQIGQGEVAIHGDITPDLGYRTDEGQAQMSDMADGG